MIFESQFDRVIGLQFFMSFTSFPSLGNSVIMDSLWEGGWEPVAQLYVHAFRMYDPIMLHNFCIHCMGFHLSLEQSLHRCSKLLVVLLLLIPSPYIP